jgi:hypothetical protein
MLRLHYATLNLPTGVAAGQRLHQLILRSYELAYLTRLVLTVSDEYSDLYR